MKMSSNVLACPDYANYFEPAGSAYAGSPEVIVDNGANPNRGRLGYYALWGVNTGKDARLRNLSYPGQPAPWDSPLKTTDQITPYVALLADLSEKGSGTGEPFGRAPHTRTGLKVTPVGSTLTPIDLAMEGGNVATPDCVVRWKKASSMLPHSTKKISNPPTQADFYGTDGQGWW